MKDGVVGYMQSSALLLFIFPPAEVGASWRLVKKLLKGGLLPLLLLLSTNENEKALYESLHH